MDIVMIVLRLLHIFAGIYWAGTAAFLVLFAGPTLQALQGKGTPFMRGLYTLSSFGTSMGLGSLLTTVSGLLLYYKVSGHFDADWMQSANGVVLSIGAVAGLLSFGHGGATLGRKSGEYATLLKQVGNDPTAEQEQTLRSMEMYIAQHSRISFYMMLVAVFGMASARYF